MSKLTDWIILFAVFWAVPIFAVWTLGLPFFGPVFWFDDVGIMLCIAWAWISAALAIPTKPNEDVVLPEPEEDDEEAA